MDLGLEVCSADGAKRVDADGKPISSGEHHAHDCCCSADLAAPLPGQLTAETPARHSFPGSLATFGQLSAQWLAPLSRGPPALI
ncbi:DUF2946 family protein [Piscinibacter sp.]|uniref:DUF2946 family protein n=1 Tax=Piscinibacter sp. TaxID=1903157 RepID=UPI003559BC29